MGARRGRHSLSVPGHDQRCNGRTGAPHARRGAHHAEHVVVGQPGGPWRDRLPGRLGQEVRGRAPEHQDRDEAAEHRGPRSRVPGRRSCQEGPGHRVLLGRHQHPRGWLGRQHHADLDPASAERVEALHQWRRGHLGRQALHRTLVLAAVVSDPVSQGRAEERRHRRGADDLEPAAGGLQDASGEGHHPDGRRHQGRLVRRLAVQPARFADGQVDRRCEGRSRRHEEVHRPRAGRVVDPARADEDGELLERRHRLARPLPGAGRRGSPARAR